MFLLPARYGYTRQLTTVRATVKRVGTPSTVRRRPVNPGVRRIE